MSEATLAVQAMSALIEWLGPESQDRLLALGDGPLGRLLAGDRCARVDHAELPAADVRWNLPFLANSYDKVYAVDLLQAEHPSEHLLAELNRVLVDRGLLVLPCAAVAQPARFQQAGFTIEATQRLDNLPNQPGMQYDGAQWVRLRKTRRFSYHLKIS